MKENNNLDIKVKFKGITIKAVLIYRKRKNITIEIKPKDNIRIISPSNVSIERIEDIIIEKGDWILDKLEEYKDMNDIYSKKEFKTGEVFYYLGEEFVLNIIQISKNKTVIPQIYIEEDKIVFITNNIEETYIKNHLKKWYKQESERIVQERLVVCKDQSNILMKLTPRTLKVKEQKKRWGSCTSNKDIYINSKICMARKSAIDYIIIHEFCHLMYMNHSKDFYSLVKLIMPNYRLEEEWLKINSHKLYI